MDALFRRQSARAENHLLVVVLGSAVTKAVYVRRDAEGLTLLNYLLLTAPGPAGSPSSIPLAQHLKTIKAEMGLGPVRTLFVIGMAEAFLRTIELPPMAPAAIRYLVKANSNHFFQQNLADHQLDGAVLAAPAPTAEATPPSASQPQTSRKQLVLVGGVETSRLQSLCEAAREAEMLLVNVTISQVSLLNAARLALPTPVSGEEVGLLDIGFQTSTISFLAGGRLDFMRVIRVGDFKLTNNLAESLGVPYQAAEAMKAVSLEKLQAKLTDCVAPLGTELKTATEFFEVQHEKPVSRIYVSGGAARAEPLVSALQRQLGIPCQTWSPIESFQQELAPPKADSLAKDAPQLVVALGAAAGWFKPELIQIGLLAERMEVERRHRRNPVRWSLLAAGLVVLCTLVCAGQVVLQHWIADSEQARAAAELELLQPVVKETQATAQRVGEVTATLAALDNLATNRFLWAGPLNALQFAVVSDVQVLRFQVKQEYYASPQPGETLTVIIRARNSGPPAAIDRFIEAIAAQPYFARHLRKDNPVTLRERLQPQIDPLNPAKSFVIFTVECFFAERPL